MHQTQLVQRERRVLDEPATNAPEPSTEQTEESPLRARQLALEDEMRDIGRTNYLNQAMRERDRGNQSSTRGARLVIKRLIEPIAEAIQNHRKGKRGFAGAGDAELRALPPLHTAFLAVRVILDQTSPPRHVTLCERIGRAINEEWAAREWRKRDTEFFDQQVAALNARSSNAEHRRRVLNALVSKRTEGQLRWSTYTRTRVGAIVLDAVMSATGLVERYMVKDKKGLTPRIRLSHKATRLLQDAHDLIALYTPFLLPMVHPPRPWTGPREGGYLTKIPGIGFVSGKHAADLEEHEESMKRVYALVSRIQETGFRVNRRVLEVADHFAAKNIALAGLPPTEDEPIPPKPPDIEDNQQARDMWRRAARIAYNRNAEWRGKRVALTRILYLAHRFENEAAIYYPKRCDFRGRVYDIPYALNPQGSDLAKGLLEFADGVPLAG